MAKTSTQFSIASFISQDNKNLSALNDGLSLSAEKEDSLREYPSEAVIKNILNFSKALKIEKSRHTGFVEIVLN